MNTVFIFTLCHRYFLVIRQIEEWLKGKPCKNPQEILIRNTHIRNTNNYMGLKLVAVTIVQLRYLK